MNVLLDRINYKVKGVGRTPLPFELSIGNVNTEGLTKTLSYTEKEQKFSEEGLPLYLLPQEPLIEEIEKEITVESTNKTDSPVMIEVERKVPILDDNGEQVEYEVIQYQTIPAIIDEETGEVIEEERVEEIHTGVFHKCFTVELIEQQKKDNEGNKLYYDTEIITEEIATEQEPLEITEEDESFSEGLEKVFVDVEKEKVITFEDDMYEFTLEDILLHKYQNILNESQFDSILAETFTSYEVTGLANKGFGFINIPSKSTVELNYNLDKKVNRIALLEIDASSDVVLKVNGATLKDTTSLNQSSDEITLSLINNNEYSIDIKSIALGY